MPPLTEEEKTFLEDKFEEFKSSFWKKFKLPAIGLAVVFAGLVSVFATYLYMQAKINVMQAQEDLTKAKVTFYEGMMKANQEITEMVEVYNKLAIEAGESVDKMKIYEEELERIVKNHQRLKSLQPSDHPTTELPSSLDPTVPPKLVLPPNKEVFKIDPQMQQQLQIPRQN